MDVVTKMVETAVETARNNPMLVVLVVIIIMRVINSRKPFPHDETWCVQKIESIKAWRDAMTQSNDNIVVVDFFATWCPPCKQAAPHFGELSKEMKGKGVLFYKVNVDNVSEVSKLAGIQAMVGLFFFSFHILHIAVQNIP